MAPSPEATPAGGWFARLRTMPNESPAKMLLVAVSLCLVCSILVSSAAVLLRPIQERNAALSRQEAILEVAGILSETGSIPEQFQQIEAHMVDLDSGKYVEGEDPILFDARKSASDVSLSDPVPADEDIARIQRRPRHMPVFLLRKDGRMQVIVLPVYGYGLWSTLYGYLALEADGRTLRSIRFYEHQETPGLGAEIDNPRWRARWRGVESFDESGELRFAIVKGRVEESARPYTVDAIAGATLTSDGVSRLVRYWLGPQGFGPYLKRLHAEEAAAR